MLSSHYIPGAKSTLSPHQKKKLSTAKREQLTADSSSTQIDDLLILSPNPNQTGQAAAAGSCQFTSKMKLAHVPKLT